jgi:hypothetical protein
MLLLLVFCIQCSRVCARERRSRRDTHAPSVLENFACGVFTRGEFLLFLFLCWVFLLLPLVLLLGSDAIARALLSCHFHCCCSPTFTHCFHFFVSCPFLVGLLVVLMSGRRGG